METGAAVAGTILKMKWQQYILMAILDLAGKLAKREAVRAKSGWPPACAVILHQPKRPSKK